MACLPNVRHWRVTWPLVLHGLSKYQDEGSLDRTPCGFSRAVRPQASWSRQGRRSTPLPPWVSRGTRARRLARLSLGMLEPFLEFQYLITARKTGRSLIAIRL